MNSVTNPPQINVETTFDLSSLPAVPLNRYHAAMLQQALKNCSGSPAWRHRKAGEAHDLLALAQISKRLLILGIDLGVDFRAEFLMRAPVATMPELNGPLKIADSARLGLVYRQEGLVVPQPGYSWITILSPRNVFLPNVAGPNAPVQGMCLGNLPAGVLTRDLILIAYHLLTVSEIQMNPHDGLGLLSPLAAEYFQKNAATLVPLSREPFLPTQAVP